MSVEVVDSTTPVKVLKRVAAALNIESAGAEKPDLVASVKRRRLETQGFDWLVDPAKLFTSITFDFEPTSKEERIYQLRTCAINYKNEPEFAKKITAATRDELATLPEFKKAFKDSEARLEAEGYDNEYYARYADFLADGVIVKATVRRDILDDTGIDEDDEDTPSKYLPLDTVVLTLSSDHELTIFFGDGYAIVKKPEVAMLDIVLAIEEAALEHSWPERVDKVSLGIEMRVEKDDDGTRMIVSTTV